MQIATRQQDLCVKMDTTMKETCANPKKETCANPGCDQPGTNKCSGCKTAPYCGPICQKAHWAIHKESCDGHLHKLIKAHLDKGLGFYRENNWLQVLRYGDLAITKMKQLKDCPLDDMSDALAYKCDALGFMGRHREQLVYAKEWYCLWNTKPTDMGAIRAALALIRSCLHNNEFVDAHLYASTLWEIINHKHDNKIPDNKRQRCIAEGAYALAQATLQLAKNGGIPAKEKQKAGQEAIALACKALEIHTQVYGNDNRKIGNDIALLADALDFFNNNNDEEVLRLYEQAKTIHTREFGSSSVNVAMCEGNLGNAYYKRAENARDANNLDRTLANLELTLSHYREENRIYRAIGRMEMADKAAQNIVAVGEALRMVASEKAAAAAAVATKGRGL